MKRTVINKLVALVLILSQLMAIPAIALTTEEMSLTSEQKEVVYEQIEEINNKYEIGEPFSKEDQAFIEKYVPLLNKPSKQSSDIGLMYDDGDTADFYNYKTSSDGLVTAVIAGICINEVNTMTMKHGYGADYTTSVQVDGREYLNSITSEVTCTAYGLVGSDGQIGKVYDDELTSSTSTYVLDFDEYENYTAVVVYAVVNVKSTIRYDYGSFSVNATF